MIYQSMWCIFNANSWVICWSVLTWSAYNGHVISYARLIPFSSYCQLLKAPLHTLTLSVLTHQSKQEYINSNVLILFYTSLGWRKMIMRKRWRNSCHQPSLSTSPTSSVFPSQGRWVGMSWYKKLAHKIS